MRTRAFTTLRHAGLPASGFTLIELLVTIALVAILAALAYPNYREFLVNMTVTDNTNDLVGALSTARAEAVKRGRAAAVIANGAGWGDGWQVVSAGEVAGTPPSIQSTPTSPGDSAEDCAGYLDNQVDAASTIPLCSLHRDALAEGYRIFGKNDKGEDIDMVVFSSIGAVVGAEFVDFSICRPAEYADAKKSRRIHVNASGAVETSRDTTGAPAGDCH